MGACLATAGALALPDQPAFVLLPLLVVLGFIGGGLWALVPGVLRALHLVNETISTLLLNDAPPLIVSYLILGRGAILRVRFIRYHRLSPTRPGSRASSSRACMRACSSRSLCLALYWFVTARTRFGLDMRAIGGNPEAARRLGIPVLGLHPDRDVRRGRDRRACRDGGSHGHPGPPGFRAVAGLRLRRLPRVVARPHHRRRNSRHGVPLRGHQLGRRHSADHAGAAVRRRQYPDGGHPVHRAGRQQARSTGR